MDFHDIANYRLHNQYICQQSSKTPVDVARYMGAMQAQDYYGTLWAIGLRTGRTEKEVIAALENREIVRTWPQRGTLHVVPAEDAKWMVSLSAERLLRAARRRREALELDDDTLAHSKQALMDALQGGKSLTRPDVMATLEKSGISTKGQRGYHILWYLSQTGVIVVGPMAGKQQTFALLDEWAANSRQLTREQSIAELASRYFSSHGPATIQDFMWWSGLTAADAKAGLNANQSSFISQKITGKEYWLSKASFDSYEACAVKAYMLPGFDEYLLGYKDRSVMLPIAHAGKIVPGSNGMFLSTIIINGQVAGTWKRTIKKDRVEIKISSFEKLSKTDKLLLQEPADQYAHFLGLPASLEF